MKHLVILAFLVFGVTSAFSQSYNRAIGLRLGWDYGLTYRHFISSKAAIEGIATYRSYGVPGFSYNYLRITGLYLLHNPIEDVPGLSWYYGFGASVSIWGGDYSDWVGTKGSKKYSSTGIGLHGALGLDYKFEEIPLNLSIDWIPTFVIGSYYGGFAAGYGGLAARYTF